MLVQDSDFENAAHDTRIFAIVVRCGMDVQDESADDPAHSFKDIGTQRLGL